ncbi:MAG: arsenical pump-driving ATPase [Elusimicrobia bacterium GWA2_66_18]|nr:MAG: arsenical pump-driving ATPase [Elusimicrobia bacterium GWA2_66_18]
MKPPMSFLKTATRHMFFTGKGGVGKTSLSCAVAVALADSGKRVLLVSTDPASNLDEVLGTTLSSHPTAIKGVPRLSALNIDPERAAHEYRERVVGPYRKVLPKAAVASIEEQLSGACTTEIASFDEFSKLLGDPAETKGFDHVIFDTAPTGHTLRLLELPAAWSGFIEANAGGTSCLGPLSGLKTQQSLYAASRKALSDAAMTTVVLVSRPERTSLEEAERTRRELADLSVKHLTLAINGIFKATDSSDPIGLSLEKRGYEALKHIPKPLSLLPRMELPLLAFALVGADSLRDMLRPDVARPHAPVAPVKNSLSRRRTMTFSDLVSDLEGLGRGVVMTMGKGGVGKTSVAVSIAVDLAKRGHAVRLTTTDPSAHVEAVLHGETVRGLQVSRIDPEAETQAYTKEVLGTAGRDLDKKGRALLEEELRSPCTAEIAVFRAFARAVDEGQDGFVVIDTAPTGHTLLLLDAAEAYHREVSRSMGDIPEAVRKLLPRLRDRKFTRMLLVTLPEATPVHEAAALQRDLKRAGIAPYAWVINQSLTPVETRDPVLAARRANERRYIDEACALSPRVALVPWLAQDAGATRYTRGKSLARFYSGEDQPVPLKAR